MSNKSKKIIQLFKPSLGKEEIDALQEVFKTGWVGLGPKTAKFEEVFAEYVGMKYAVGVNSCTAALHLALKVCGIDSGEVIVPTLTFVSTAHAVLYNSARVVFADVDEKTLCIDAEDVQRKVTPQTKAIIPVDLYGQLCDYDKINKIAKDNNLLVIEDACQAVNASFGGKKAGSFGDIGCFSSLPMSSVLSIFLSLLILFLKK